MKSIQGWWMAQTMCLALNFTGIEVVCASRSLNFFNAKKEPICPFFILTQMTSERFTVLTSRARIKNTLKILSRSRN